MADNESLHGDRVAAGTFSHLLFVDDDVLGLHKDTSFPYTSHNPPKILCFSDYGNKCDLGKFSETPKSPQKSGLACSESSSQSSINTTKTPLSEVNKKRNGSENLESMQSFIAWLGAPAGNQKNCKKTKSEKSMVTRHGKVKREKLGERITALQQLVSPYGKTDTASVLHEAMGYIRFLQEQVQVLCFPYLQRLPSLQLQAEERENGEAAARKDLRSRGLCLVPLECIAHVANNNNGADFWSPATMANNFSPKH
ncbi:basic helix-loop-helix (bHLH) DNA-binding superfamily protein [Actinidia rufa]|uniref:Basic helix-loop-helix (BHLH) DNA-binding superfamily protein n=1 Tax=Actinidia rufa TaxID=165716 RepID=A0A7J0DTH0_9ERIC|nr:basic helix-loop-helix (bHLH) DNA-binding superfamily protein [Actinidia rufa]